MKNLPPHPSGFEELANLLRRGKVRLSADGADVAYAEKTERNDGSLGLRLKALEAPSREHLQFIVHPIEGRVVVLTSDEDAELHSPARHTRHIDVDVHAVAHAMPGITAWLPRAARILLGNTRVAFAQTIAEERIVVADEMALRETLSNAPFVSKSKGTRLDVLPLSEKCTVVAGDAFGHSACTVGGRLGRHRGRLVVSHLVVHAETHPLVGFVNLSALMLSLDEFRTIGPILATESRAFLAMPQDEPLALTDVVQQLALLPEVLCRRGVLKRQELGVTRRAADEPGLPLPVGLIDEFCTTLGPAIPPAVEEK